MLITKMSLLTGRTHAREIDITPEQYDRWRGGYGGMIQDQFPHLSVDDREFLLSGSTPEEWAAAFKNVREEER